MRKVLSLSLLSLSVMQCLACTETPGTPGTPDGGTPEGDSGACTSASTGSIAINVTGLPAGVQASVTITGSGGAQTAHASGAISVASGDYTVTAATVTEADPIVR